MDIVAAAVFGVASVWLIAQDFISTRVKIYKGVPTLAAALISGIVAADWFFGRKAILGHPGSFLHTCLKIMGIIVLFIIVGSGITEVQSSKNRAAIVLNILIDLALIAVVLHLFGSWSFK